MNRWMKSALLLLLAGCAEKQQETYLVPEKALQYFSRIEQACNKDNGKLWGKNLYGPVMFVDRNSRKIFANQSDLEGLLKGKDGIFLGTYPKELMISNNAVRYGGTLFAMAPIPSEEDGDLMINRAIHALFHCFQESAGLNSSGYNTNNMDEKNARLWIKLEWKALRKALNSEGAEQQLALRDALVFKGSNREQYPEYVSEEIKFENYEGLAAFTSILLTAESPEQNKEQLFEYLDRIYSRPSFSRSYGAVTGALYANLLHIREYDFKSIKSENVDLSEEVRKLFEVQLPEVCRDVAGSIALNYEVGIIQNEEAEREADIKERIHRRMSTFIEKPVVYLELLSPYFDFEDTDIHPMDTLGTLYNALRVSDNWGKLTVENGGCLVSNNLKYLRITARGYKADKNRINGEGWHLVLNNGWALDKVNDNYLVRKQKP